MHLTVTVEADDQDVQALIEEALRATQSASEESSGPSPVGVREPHGSTEPSARAGELPEEWNLVEGREGESYRWPSGVEHYESFRVFEGSTSTGTLRLALAEHAPIELRGGLRKYYVVFYVTAGSKRPLVTFQAADDYEQTQELVAIIRGRDGGRKMYGPGDALPEAYESFPVEEFNERIVGPGSLHKFAVVAREDDAATMLAHGYLQARQRFGIEPS